MNRVDVVAVTHRGRVREHNEDAVAVAGFLSTVVEGEPTRFALDTTRPVTCVVADGLGGHAAGERASRLAASVISDAGPTLHDGAAVTAAVLAADAAIRTEAALCPEWTDMGTTVVVLTVHGDRAFCVNVGDSRCYLMRDGVLVQLSTDDSPLPVEGGYKSGVVTQTLGGNGNGTVEPHLQRTHLDAGDRFLLCSDGLTDYVSEDRVEERLADRPDGLAALRDLLRDALDAGGGDNISAILVTIREDDGERAG
jgi:serine/threonine protein phosphatase PrpC